MTSSITSSPLNVFFAANSAAGRQSLGTALVNNARDDVTRALKSQDQSVKLQAQSLAVKAGKGAVLTTKYEYDIGPDGQAYVSGVTVSSQRKVEGPVNPLDKGKNGFSSSTALSGNKPASFADLLNPRAALSPIEEAQLFSSAQFAEDAATSVDGLNRAKLQVADFGVRAQEKQHFRAGGGLTSLPEYGYQVGPDGELYATSGNVGISTPSGADPAKAARNAQTAANAALAATDVSAQDVSVARSAQNNAAAFTQEARKQLQVTQQYQKQSDLVYTTNPVFGAAA